jgi:phosphopantetheinyl transferase
MQLLTHLLPEPLSSELVLGWCSVQVNYSEDILTDVERKDWNAFSGTGRRREYLAARWLVRQLASELNINPDEFVLSKDKWGKPYGMIESQKFFVSIAHTEERVVCGISSTYDMGLDMEPASRSVPDRLRGRMINEQEEALLAQVDALRIWTIKEALVKLQGRGMRTNLRECIVDTVNDTIFEATIGNENRAKIFSFKHLHNWLTIAWKCYPIH